MKERERERMKEINKINNDDFNIFRNMNTPVEQEVDVTLKLPDDKTSTLKRPKVKERERERKRERENGLNNDDFNIFRNQSKCNLKESICFVLNIDFGNNLV